MSDVDLQAGAGATVGLADDDVLRDVDQTTGSGSPDSGGTQSRIDQALTGRRAVAMKYVENGEALAVVCL